MNITKIIQRARKSVVRIYADVVGSSGKSEGSGVIIDKSGIILTNHHVVRLNKAVVLVLFDWRIDAGRLIYSDPYRDIALIYMPLTNLVPADLGYSIEINIGEEIIAIGHPEQLPYSVSKGIVSHPARIYTEKPGLVYIQFDASSQPGSSGGPLLNLQGKVIGIVCSGFGETLNLAIPIHAIKPCLLKILNKIDRYKKGNYCHVCGEANDSREKFCQNCGVKLTTRTELEEILRRERIEIKNFVVCKHCDNLNIMSGDKNIYPN